MGRANRVLIVAFPEDEHADRLEQLVIDRSARVVRISYGDLPDRRLMWGPGSPLRVGNKWLLKGSAIWRRPGGPNVHAMLPEYAEFAGRESTDALLGGLEGLSLRWLAAPHDLVRAERKLVQLAAARELSVPIPDTVVTNSPVIAERFATAHGDVIVKPVRYGLVSREPPMVAWTRATTADELSRLNGPPVIIQSRVRAIAHLRIVTIGTRAFTFELRTDELDWRIDIANHSRFEWVTSSRWDGPAASALRLADRLEVGLSSQDWIVDRAGTAVFLEANPSGQWMFLDDACDMRLSAAIADRLIELAA